MNGDQDGQTTQEGGSLEVISMGNITLIKLYESGNSTMHLSIERKTTDKTEVGIHFVFDGRVNPPEIPIRDIQQLLNSVDVLINGIGNAIQALDRNEFDEFLDVREVEWVNHTATSALSKFVTDDMGIKAKELPNIEDLDTKKRYLREILLIAKNNLEKFKNRFENRLARKSAREN